LSLAKEIDKNGRKDNRSIDCLIQIKISNDESKYGLNPEQLDSFYADLKEFENINIIGLMAMATYTKDQSLIADEFKKMEKLFKEMKTIDSNFKILSIGMSDDYQLAINNGSNMIRVGSKIFGQRNY
jgi:pyridoxal phosphate enzyme (YggS family)